MVAEEGLTVTSLVDEVLDAVQGYVRSQEISTSLDVGIDNAALSFTVTDASKLSTGVVQIEDELVQVGSVAGATGTVEPWGRGLAGSEVTDHGAGAKVIVAPAYSRQRVRSAIYGALREMFPDVYAVTETLVDSVPLAGAQALPSDCYHVLSVEAKQIGPANQWTPVRRWRQGKAATVTLEVFAGAPPGADMIRVQYMRTPPATLDSTDSLTGYGYDKQLRDVIVLGATARLVAYGEAGRAQLGSAEALGRTEGTPSGSFTAASRALYQMFKSRVQDEARQLQLRYPLQSHMTR